MKLFLLIRENIVLIAIFALALFLRTYQLADFPVGLHGDEASIGYNAYSILKTGLDQDGKRSLAIDQFGDFRPAGYHYIDVPFVALLGLNETAVRLPGALFGSLNVILIYLLINRLFKKRNMALLGAGLLAILPWDINISRATSEGIIASFFVTLGILLFITSLEKKNRVHLFFALSAVSFLTSFLFYHAARYFTVLFVPFLTLHTYLTDKKRLLLSFIVLVAVGLGIFFFLSIGKGTGRVSEVSLLSIPGGTVHLKQAMDEEGTANPLITRFYSNKLIYYGRFFVTFYSQHLSGDFLFVNNGSPIRYWVPFTGNLYLIQAPFLLLGLAFLLTEGLKSKKYHYLIPVAWLLIAPIPAGLTWEDLPNIQRSSLMIIPLVIITVFGFVELLSLLKNRLKILVIVIVILSLAHGFLYFYHNYFWRLRIHEPWHRGYATKELVFNIENIGKENPKAKFIMTTQNYNNFIFYLFFTKFDPKTFQNLGSPKEENNLKFANLTYINDDCPIRGSSDINATVEPNIYYVGKPECPLPKNAEIVNVIRRSDGLPAFHIVKLNDPILDTNSNK
ncbi:MAG: glycosyltransferase family 39 protein [Candidatus Levybacteria bacterium]|nr:glycosyltransferase family 39 protein [Candidatus Levybacteria bacterium]